MGRGGRTKRGGMRAGRGKSNKTKNSREEVENVSENESKSNLDLDESSMDAVADSPAPKKQRKDDESSKTAQKAAGASLSVYQSSYSSSRRERRAISPSSRYNMQPKQSFHDCLGYLYKMIVRKDNNKFFAFPINDTIAPGYTKVVTNPMDFHTIYKKIEGKIYENVMEFKHDVQLICTNAMNYNHPDTVYYKAAQKLLEYATKLLSGERLEQLRRSVPQLSGLTDMDLALHMDINTDAVDYIAPIRKQKKRKDKESGYVTFEPIPDHLPVKDLTAINKERCEEASRIKDSINPSGRMVCLRTADDGSTTLTFLNPDNDGVLNEREHVTTVGEKIGRLKTGKPFLESLLVDDSSTSVTPSHYLDYGGFNSNAPVYDSTFSSLSKQETDLLLAAYGNNIGVDYVRSVTDFISGSSPYLRDIIDTQINNSTSGQHCEVQKKMRSIKETHLKTFLNAAKQNVIETEKPDQSNPQTSEDKTTSEARGDKSNLDSGGDKSKPETGNKSSRIDYDSLATLSELGIDMSFISSFKLKDEVQKKLDSAAVNINDLYQLQNERLNHHPTVDKKSYHIGESEKTAAKQVQSELTEVIKEHFNPSDIISESTIHKILTIQHVNDLNTLPDNQPADDSEGLPDVPTSAADHHIPLERSPTTTKQPELPTQQPELPTQQQPVQQTI